MTKRRAAAARAAHTAAATMPAAHATAGMTPALAAQPVPMLAHALVSLATALTFARALPYPLQLRWDDGRFLADNPLVREPSWNALLAILREPHFEAYHPLHLLSYWLDVPFLKDWSAPLSLRAVQLALWVLAANFVLRAFAGLGLRAPFAVLATLACVLHPIQVEAVVWITGRKDVLALLFVAASLGLHLRATHPLGLAAWGSRVLYALAALSKTTALPLPLALIGIDVLVRRKPLRAAVLSQLPSLALGAGLAAWVLGIWRDHAMLRPTESTGAWPLRILATIEHQLGTVLWPRALSPLYPTDELSPTIAGSVLVLGLALATALLVRARQRPHARAALAGVAWCVVFLAPVSNAVPMYFPLQDRYASLPLVGIAYAAAALAQGLGKRGANAQPMVLAIAGACVVALALRTVVYQGEWRSETRLWGHAVSVQPHAFYAFIKLGETRREAGDLHGAERAYEQAIALRPRRVLAHAALLQTRVMRDERDQRRQGKHSLAMRYAEDYFKAIDDPAALRALATRMLNTGHVRALELPLGRALDLAPVPDRALERAARTQLDEGREGLARFYVARMRARPSDPQLAALRSDWATKSSPSP